MTSWPPEAFPRPIERAVESPELEARFLHTATRLLDQYAPASEAELHLTHDVIRAFWLSNHWKLRRLDAKKKQKAFLAANPGSPPCPELKREDEFARWHSIKQSLFLARRRELFNQIRQQYEADLVAAGYTLEEARSAFWQAAPSAEAEHPELPCAA